MGDLVCNLLDGSKEERTKAMREFFGLEEGQSFQDIKIEDEDKSEE